MKLRTILSLAALAAPAAAFALGSGSPTQSSPHQPKMPKMKSSPHHTKMPKSAVPKFKKADANNDGKIEWKEAKALGVPKKLFKQDDFSHTGKLDKTEWQFVRIEMPAHKKGSPPGGA